MDLLLSNNSATNPLSLDVTNYIQVSDESMDPASPAFTDKVISHSLLREGGALALEDFKNKELIFPLLIMGPSIAHVSSTITTLNQILRSPGATAQWQDDGTSQATYFDLISSQFDVEYSYRKGQVNYTSGKLRLFAQPLGRTATPRFYAAATSPGPLLMVSPRFIAGNTAVGGVSGVGGVPPKYQWLGPTNWHAGSGGMFYASQYLQGDVGAQLQLIGSMPSTGQSYVQSKWAISLLPDDNYAPIVGGSFSVSGFGGSYTTTAAADAALGSYVSFHGGMNFFDFPPLPAVIPPNWAGAHRMFAIARASGAAGTLVTTQSQSIPITTVASIPQSATWDLYDLGTIRLSPSQLPTASGGNLIGSCPGGWLDVTALITLPENGTWFMSAVGTGLAASTVQTYAAQSALMVDDTGGGQYLGAYTGIISWAPGVVPTVASALTGAELAITPYSRGLIPRPDPANGAPVIAMLYIPGPGAGTPISQLLGMRVNALERALYIFP